MNNNKPKNGQKGKGVKKKTKKLLKMGTFVVTHFFTIICGISIVTIIGVVMAFVIALSADDDDSDCNVDTTATTTQTGGSAGAWTKKGSLEYNHAKGIWDAWANKGFSGNSVAGIIGCLANEGGFSIYDRAEGHYGPDEKTNGISEGVEPGGNGGGGPYQFTKYTKYAPLKSKDWLDIDKQTEFVWNSEIKNGVSALDKRHISLKEMATASTPEDGAFNWADGYERGRGMGDRNNAGVKKRMKDARTAYELFGGEKIKANSALWGASGGAQTGSSKEDSDNDNCSTSTSDSDSGIITAAKKFIGYFSYDQVHAEKFIGSVKNPDRNGRTDCSGFVWLVLKICGYKVPDNMQWYTKSMEDDAKGKHKYLQEIKPNDAKAGDVVIVNTGSGAGNEGHTAILEENWKDGSDKGNKTKIIEMGGIPSAHGVNESNFGDSFMSLVAGSHTTTFARPQK
jgi:cell wall-associated NlpC family hydrolase